MLRRIFVAARVCEGGLVMAISAALIRELRGWVDFDAETLLEALQAGDGDLEKAVVHLIDEGTVVELRSLNARAAPERLFVRALRSVLERELREARVILDFLKGLPQEAATRRTIERKARELKDPKTFRGLREQVARGQKNFTPEAIEASVGTAQAKAKAKKSSGPAVVKMPPLPKLKYDVGEWTGTDTFKAWAGFRAGGRASSGRLDVTVVREMGDDDDEDAPPAAEQVAAYKHFRQNERAIREAVLKAVFAEFTKLKRRGAFDDIDEDEGAADLARVKTAADLKRVIEPQSVGVLDHAKAGQAFIGLGFACTWDDEHGLGVLLHKSRVVKVGDAEVAFNEHGAKRDGGKRIK
jgi:hypothetical protein